MTTKHELPADLDNYIADLRIENINLKLAAKQAQELLRKSVDIKHHHAITDLTYPVRAEIESFLASQQGEQCPQCRGSGSVSDSDGCGVWYIDCPFCTGKHPEQAEGAQGELHPDLKLVYDVIGLHYSHPVSVLIANFENTKRFAELLHAVEREFFMVPGAPSDEPEDEGCEPDDVCLMSCWGSTQEQYIEQFRDVLAVIQDRAALAQPSPAPAEAEQHWPKQEKPAQVGGGRFSAGVSSRLVVEAAQRLYEFESTPEKEAERIERLQAFREQLDPLNLAPHAKAFNEAAAEALKPEQAEAERPEVAAWQYRVTAGPQTGWSLWHPGKGEEFERSYAVERRPLMTIAQHECITAQLHDALDESDGDRWKLRSERDAAQARVAELEKQEPVEFDYPEFHEQGMGCGLEDRGITDRYEAMRYGFDEAVDQFARIIESLGPLYAAPVAQAVQVPQAWLDVQTERRRQVEAEGWTPEHDDEHDDGKIAEEAASFLMNGQSPRKSAWSWKHKHPDSPTRASRRRQLVIGVALGLAEIERLDRAAAPAQGGAA